MKNIILSIIVLILSVWIAIGRESVVAQTDLEVQVESLSKRVLELEAGVSQDHCRKSGGKFSVKAQANECINGDYIYTWQKGQFISDKQIILD